MASNAHTPHLSGCLANISGRQALSSSIGPTTLTCISVGVTRAISSTEVSITLLWYPMPLAIINTSSLPNASTQTYRTGGQASE